VPGPSRNNRRPEIEEKGGRERAEHHGLVIGRRELLEADLAKESWGNLPANLDFLDRTGLLHAEARILEIGCGKGALLGRLTEAGHDVVGLDHDHALVSQGGRHLRTCCGDASELPFPAYSFDLVLGMDVFEHIPDTDRHLAEIHRVLAPGGYYILETPNILFNFPFEMFRNVRRLGWRRMFAFLEPPWHCALHSYWGVKRDFRRGGFSIRFVDVPVVTDWFVDKLRRFTGGFGPAMLKVFNPDRMPLPLRTNFFVVARAEER
jgi:SAM-dependent methyltransferase